MKKICFVTGTRADYGIMSLIMKEVAKHQEVTLQVVATNMHLSPEFGMTVLEIEKDGFNVDEKIESLVPGGTAKATVKSMAKAEEGLAECFERLNPDMVVILGDRYEALAAASAAIVFNIPIAHLHGGEKTEGAIDDKFRHAITQLSSYHFASTPQYAQRIISMGMSSENVFHSGAPGAEVMENVDKSLAEEFYKKTGLTPYDSFVILAFHPVTLSEDKGLEELKNTIEALNQILTQGYKVLVTMPNSDPGTTEISALQKEWSEQNAEKVIMVKSLGSSLFHFAMDHASAMIGNSSAALIEAPTYRLPAVNVGIRQKGRAHGITVFDVPADKKKIETALNAALSMEMKAVIMGVTVGSLNPYYKQNSSKFIAEKLIELCN